MMIRHKFRFLSLLILLTALAGCATVPVAPAVQITNPGPVFSKSDFASETEPLPPSKVAPEKQGSAAAHYENRLRAWGRKGWVKLRAFKKPLEASGQVQ